MASTHSPQSISTGGLESGSGISDQKSDGGGVWGVKGWGGNTSLVCPGGVVEKRLPSVVWIGRTRPVCVCVLASNMVCACV